MRQQAFFSTARPWPKRCKMEVVHSETSWWVFDRPISRDWLFIVGVVLGALSVLRAIVENDRHGTAEFVMTLVIAVPSGVLAAGLFGGTVREFVRGRRGDAG